MSIYKIYIYSFVHAIVLLLLLFITIHLFDQFYNFFGLKEVATFSCIYLDLINKDINNLNDILLFQTKRL